MTPYSATPLKSTITELYIDPTTKVARVQWSKGAAPRGAGTTVAIPTALQVGGTYLISARSATLRADDRLCDGEVRDHAERLHLYPPAPVDLRDVQHHGLHDDLIPFASDLPRSRRSTS